MSKTTVEVFGATAYDGKDTSAFNQIIFVFDDKSVLESRFVANSSNVQKVLSLSDASEFDKLVAIAGKLSNTGDAASSSETYVFRGEGRVLTKVVLVMLPVAASRHNCPARSHALTSALKGKKTNEGTIVYLLPATDNRAYAQILGAGRAFPTFTMKSSEMATAVVSKVHVVVEFPDTESAEVLADAANTVPYVRLAAQLVDTPPNVLHSDAYIAIARDIAAELNVSITVIQGQDLEAQGFGGIWGVGKAAEHLPALVILSYVPPGANAEDPSICFVGKGIVYDTGGLSIKTPTTFMAGMKMDMGGSAAVLGAFAAAVRNRSVAGPLHALLCIAENAVGPLATRPDDVHKFLSGKTVEVNNTDAEGRLVLADGVFYAHKFLNARVIIDIATLTGAQLIATGRNHAALYCNDEELEALAVVQGKYTGDLTHPMPYVPEFYRGEFKSAVADMKNSVADRSNAQVSCAGQFIGNHLEEFFARGGKWLHVDMAGPAMAGERGTGYGVALLSNIAKNL